MPPLQRRETIVIAGSLLACVGWQAWAFVSGRAGMDADEATMAIAGLDILAGRPRAFFPGQNYMGCAESYLYALLRLCGAEADPLGVRIQTALQSMLYLVSSWWLLRRTLGRRVAMAGLVWLAVPSDYLARWYMRIRGYAPAMIMGNVILGQAMAMCADPRRRAGPRGFFLLGLALGAAWYLNPIAMLHIAGVALMMASTPPVRRRLLRGFSLRWRWVALANLASVAALAILESRALAAPRHSHLLRAMYAHRGAVLGVEGLLLALAALPLAMPRLRRRVALPAGALGFVAGHAPALAVYWSRDFLNLKQSLGTARLLLDNLTLGPPVAASTILGIGALPPWALFCMGGYYIVALYVALRAARRHSFALAWLLVLPCVAWAILSMQNITLWGGTMRYLLPFAVCVAAVAGVFVSELGRLVGRWAWLALAPPMVVSLWGMGHLPARDIELPSGMPRLEAALARYCQAQPLPAVLITGTNDAAVCLTFFCEQRRVFQKALGYFNRVPEHARLFRQQRQFVAICSRNSPLCSHLGTTPRAVIGGLSIFHPVAREPLSGFLPVYGDRPARGPLARGAD